MLKTLSSFTYLCFIVSNNAKMDKGIAYRIGKVRSAFGYLYHRLWKFCDVSLKINTDVHKSVLVTSLLFGVSSCLCTDDASKLISFTCITYVSSATKILVITLETVEF